MIRPRWQKVFSDLWSNRTRSLLVIASIAVGLFAIGVILMNYLVLQADMRTGFLKVNPANIYLQTSLVNEDTLKSVATVPGVQQAMGIRTVRLRVLNSKGEWQSIDLKAVANLETMPINQISLQEGRFPGEGEIVIDRNKVDELSARIGDMVTIELASGKTRNLRLVGITIDLTIGSFSGGGGGFFQAPMQGYLTRDTLKQLDLAQPYRYNGIMVRLTQNESDFIQAAAVEIANKLENNGVSVTSTRTSRSDVHPNSILIETIVVVLIVLGMLTVFLSGSLVTNTLQALLKQQTQQIGIMKSIGASQWQVAEVYMALLLVFGLLAFAIAMPLAHLVSFVMLEFLADSLNFVLEGRRLVMEVVALQAALALLMPQIAAWVPIWQGTRISVQEALSGIQQSHKKHHASKTVQKKTWRPLGVARRISKPLIISLRNTFRRKGRLALTLLTLSLGGAIFIATFNVQVSLNEFIDRLSNYFLADVNITLQRPYRIERIEQIVKQVPGVGQVEAWAVARAELIMDDGLSGERVSLLAPPVNSPLIKPILIEGRWIREGDENAITLNELFTLRYPQLRLGDTIHLNVNGKDTAWTIVGFFQLAGRNGGYTAYTSPKYLSSLVGLPNSTSVYRVVSDRGRLSPRQQQELANQIEAHLAQEDIAISDINTGSYISSITTEGFATLTAFLLFLAVLTALVGSIGLAGTMSMNVMERTREIGVMRAIGASNRVLMRMVLVEGMLIGLLSYAIGAALSFPISQVLSDSICYSIFGAPSVFGFTINGFVLWFGVMLVLAFLASFLPASNAARLTIREVLAYE
ncbi:MAG TPA: FtsX-like permease family protein [Anaerolineaceae bacterium]